MPSHRAAPWHVRAAPSLPPSLHKLARGELHKETQCTNKGYLSFRRAADLLCSHAIYPPSTGPERGGGDVDGVNGHKE